MWVSELFQSIQGEGRFTGTASAFLRTSGCNLRCQFCDTPETSWKPTGFEKTVSELTTELHAMGCKHVVITGGEPMLIPSMVDLTRALKAEGHIITIETAGTVFHPVVADLMSISPKLSNSIPVGTAWESRHRLRQHRPEIIQQLITEYDYQLKFVIDSRNDMDEVADYLVEFPDVDPHKICLMPQGTVHEEIVKKMEWLEPEAIRLGWTVSPRKHIELFGHTRGT